MLARLVSAALLALAAPAVAQDAPPSAPAPPAGPALPASAPPAMPAAPRAATVRVTLQTSEGPIVLELEKQRAPVTTANFLHYLDTRRLDGIAFYRAVKVQPGYGLIQAGVRDPRKLFPPIAHEPTSQTGLSHVDGAISMARAGQGTAVADFFIVVGNIPSMDADPRQPGDNAGFAVFGRVVEGMEIVRHILDEPTSPTAGVGAMKGQMLAAPVRIVSARRAN